MFLGGWFRNDSNALQLLCTLLHQLYLRSSGIRSQSLGTPAAPVVSLHSHQHLCLYCFELTRGNPTPTCHQNIMKHPFLPTALPRWADGLNSHSSPASQLCPMPCSSLSAHLLPQSSALAISCQRPSLPAVEWEASSRWGPDWISFLRTLTRHCSAALYPKDMLLRP